MRNSNSPAKVRSTAAYLPDTAALPVAGGSVDLPRHDGVLSPSMASAVQHPLRPAHHHLPHHGEPRHAVVQHLNPAPHSASRYLPGRLSPAGERHRTPSPLGKAMTFTWDPDRVPQDVPDGRSVSARSRLRIAAAPDGSDDIWWR